MPDRNMSQQFEINNELEMRSGGQLKELIKSLNIQFRDRSKAGKGKIIANILEKINHKELSAEELEKELSKDKYKIKPKIEVSQRLTKKDLNELRADLLTEFDKFYRIENKLVLLTEQVQSINNKLLQMTEQLQTIKYIVDVHYDVNRTSLQNLLSTIRKANLDINNLQSFDELFKFLLKNNITSDEFIKGGTIIITLSTLTDLIRKISWPDDLIFFVKVLHTEFEKINTDTTFGVPIYQMRDIVCKRLGISREIFDRQLINCFKKGWVTLDSRSPIGEENVEYLDVDNRKYYIIRPIKNVLGQ